VRLVIYDGNDDDDEDDDGHDRDDRTQCWRSPWPQVTVRVLMSHQRILLIGTEKDEIDDFVMIRRRRRVMVMMRMMMTMTI
jgi:hypothetical protein